MGPRMHGRGSHGRGRLGEKVGGFWGFGCACVPFVFFGGASLFGFGLEVGITTQVLRVV